MLVSLIIVKLGVCEKSEFCDEDIDSCEFNGVELFELLGFCFLRLLVFCEFDVLGTGSS